jgi:hypothetical protein
MVICHLPIAIAQALKAMGYVLMVIAKEPIIVAQGPMLIAQGANGCLSGAHKFWR